MDDPVSIVLYLVTALAGGMYPLGFIFGGCSACCQGCPAECSRCNRANSGNQNDGQCYDISGNFELSIAGGSTVSGTFGGNNFSTEAASSLVLPFTCFRSSNPTPEWSFRLEASPLDLEMMQSADECNCTSCCALNPRVSLRLFHISGILFGGDANFASQPQTVLMGGQLCECSEESVTSTLTLQEYSSLLSDLFDLECRELFAEWISEQSLELVFSDVDPCECGACCTEGTCESNQTEFYCEDGGTFFDEKTVAGSWQGVGTDCDPNPCPEPPVGACCHTVFLGNCFAATQNECAQIGGVWKEGASCEDGCDEAQCGQNGWEC